MSGHYSNTQFLAPQCPVQITIHLMKSLDACALNGYIVIVLSVTSEAVMKVYISTVMSFKQLFAFPLL